MPSASPRARSPILPETRLRASTMTRHGTSRSASPIPSQFPVDRYSVTTVGGALSLDGSGSLPSGSQNLTLYEWDLDNDGDFDEGIFGPNPASHRRLRLSSPPTWWLERMPSSLRVTDDSLPAPKTAISEGTVAHRFRTSSGRSLVGRVQHDRRDRRGQPGWFGNLEHRHYQLGSKCRFSQPGGVEQQQQR